MSVTEQEMGTLLSIVSRCDEAQARRILEAVSNRRAVIGRENIRSFRVGAKVKWNGKHGPKAGTVVKVKTKYVEVKEDVPPGTHGFGLTWNVPAMMLSPVEEKKP